MFGCANTSLPEKVADQILVIGDSTASMNELATIADSIYERTYCPAVSTIDRPSMMDRELNLGLYTASKWDFLITEVMPPTMGINFLQHYNLLVDVKRHKLLSIGHNVFIRGIVTDFLSLSLVVTRQTPDCSYSSPSRQFSVTERSI
ncbi:hypothetical protein KSF78_0004650 [Schistosoma japonicum]|nr:hypothetical protein KSF78_0004650 [Schistosoma japonicum]